jgi:hypothetical protein
MHKRTPQSYQASSPPPRLEGEGQGGGVDNQRSSEAAGIADSH